MAHRRSSPITIKHGGVDSLSRSYPETHFKTPYVPHGSYDDRQIDPHTNAKGAGVIPYTYHNGELKFLLQKHIYPDIKKKRGWNDFGGSKDTGDSSAIEIACREFAEETSCLFYLKEIDDEDSVQFYDEFKDNKLLEYSPETIEKLIELIPEAKNYYINKCDIRPNYCSSGEVYITYFIKVKYIDASDIPRSEDMFKDYETRYMRECSWFTVNELLNIDNTSFSKRLQIMSIQNRIRNLLRNGRFEE